MANYCKVYLIPLHLELQTLKFIVNIKKNSKKVTLSISWASVKYPVGLNQPLHPIMNSLKSVYILSKKQYHKIER